MHRGPRSRISSRQSRSIPMTRMLCRQPIDMEDLALQDDRYHGHSRDLVAPAWVSYRPFAISQWRGKTHTLLSDFWNYSWMQEQSLTSAVLTWLTKTTTMDFIGVMVPSNFYMRLVYAAAERKIWDIIFPACLRSASIRRITDSVDSNAVLDDACPTRKG